MVLEEKGQVGDAAWDKGEKTKEVERKRVFERYQYDVENRVERMMLQKLDCELAQKSSQRL